MIRFCLIFLLVAVAASGNGRADELKPIRIGIIGLDTSHAINFTKLINQNPSDPMMHGCHVTAAYPHGSRDIESSVSRIPEYTKEIQALGVEVVDSIEKLLSQVDAVLLETNDGRRHLEQALEVFRAGLPVFIDKPTGANLSEVVAIFRAAEHFNVPMFSSSALRYTDGAQAIRGGAVGNVVGCDAYSPCALEPTHVDLYWYGIHGVESLYTCMGMGCQSVSHTQTDDFEFSVGVWTGGRIGTFRGMRAGKRGYGGTAFGETGTMPIGDYGGYQPLLRKVTEFFRTRELPIDPAETMELYAFMQAAYESKQQGGTAVTIAAVMEAAERQADQLLAGKLDR